MAAVGLFLKLTSRGRRYGQVFVSSLRLGAVSSNEARASEVNIDVELFFIARNGRVLPLFYPFYAIPNRRLAV